MSRFPAPAHSAAGEILGYVLRDPHGRQQADPHYPTAEDARAAVRGQTGWRVGAVGADGAVRFDDAVSGGRL